MIIVFLLVLSCVLSSHEEIEVYGGELSSRNEFPYACELYLDFSAHISFFERMSVNITEKFLSNKDVKFIMGQITIGPLCSGGLIDAHTIITVGSACLVVAEEFNEVLHREAVEILRTGDMIINPKNLELIPSVSFVAVFGRNNMSEAVKPENVFTTTKFEVHPLRRYNTSAGYDDESGKLNGEFFISYDVGVIKFDEPILETEAIRYANFPKQHSIRGMKFMLAGFGVCSDMTPIEEAFWWMLHTTLGPPIDGFQRKLEVDLLDVNKRCGVILEDNTGNVFFGLYPALCFEAENEYHGPCFLDMGAPVVAKEADGSYTIYAIVSFYHLGCGHARPTGRALATDILGVFHSDLSFCLRPPCVDFFPLEVVVAIFFLMFVGIVIVIIVSIALTVSIVYIFFAVHRRYSRRIDSSKLKGLERTPSTEDDDTSSMGDGEYQKYTESSDESGESDVSQSEDESFESDRESESESESEGESDRESESETESESEGESDRESMSESETESEREDGSKIQSESEDLSGEKNPNELESEASQATEIISQESESSLFDSNEKGRI